MTHDPEELNEVLNSISDAIHRLGSNHADTQMGSLENLALEVRHGSDAIVEAINRLTDVLAERG